jgi:LPS export ABC transporter permease LptF/LPS export ABC transporter permease LptG
MSILSRKIFREIAGSAIFGIILFTFVLFLRKVGPFFALLVKSSAPPKTLAYLFSLMLPMVFAFTIPVGVLVGVLMTLSRMSSDGEITALRSSGVPARRVGWPVATFAIFSMLATASATLWLSPWSIRQMNRLLTTLDAAQLSAEIQPRVFQEDFPNTILYVGDVVTGPKVVKWKDVFLADVTPPGERKNGTDAGSGPRITVASEAIALPDPANNRLRLVLLNGSTHAEGKSRDEYLNTRFDNGDQLLEASSRGERHASNSFVEMDTVPLSRAARNSTDASIELHQRLAMPFACIVFGLIGIALGVSSRKAGKSSAFVLTVAIAFLYWMGFISLIGLARQNKLPVWFALWLPNIVLGITGLFSFVRLELPGDRDFIGEVQDWIKRTIQNLRGTLQTGPAPVAGRSKSLLAFLPQIVDTYVLSTFLFYFLLLLSSFVLMTQVYNFFELLPDVVKNRAAMSLVFKHLFFLSPLLIYDSTPISVLVAVLVTFGILTKNNEVTAFKACGVSLYRLAVPVFIASLIISGVLFAFDFYYIPQANIIQEALRNQIKAKPVQTYLDPNRKWIFGEHSQIYYYKYFDRSESMMVGVSVFELDPQTFQLRRHISAERARWEPSLNTWIFQNGWARDISKRGVTAYQAFPGGTGTFAELKEPPGYFLKEDLQEKQMNFVQLSSYIRELRQSGFDTVHLQIEYYKKFSLPLFAVIMALLSVPFAFTTGNRGAMAGIGVSFGIAVAYWSVNALFEQIGTVNQLPPMLAAWSPNLVFSLAGLYFLARMRT